MKNINLSTGRVRQKTQTRNKILQTAQQLLQTGALFSLEEVAKAMNISRATIYRYYSHVDQLYAEAVMSFQVRQPEELVADVKGKGLADSLIYVQKYYSALAQQHEMAFRKYLSVVLNESIQKGESAPLRRARRPATLELLLKPHIRRIGVENAKKLKQIITLLTGIEPLIVNKDVSGLSGEDSTELLQWGLEMILKGLGLDKD